MKMDTLLHNFPFYYFLVTYNFDHKKRRSCYVKSRRELHISNLNFLSIEVWISFSFSNLSIYTEPGDFGQT